MINKSGSTCTVFFETQSWFQFHLFQMDKLRYQMDYFPCLLKR